MGWAARANRAKKLEALANGTFEPRDGIMKKMRPHPMPPAVAAMLMHAHLMTATSLTQRPGRRRISPTGRL